MGRLPEGTVTLLFSDIEGSTQLLSRLGPVYGQVLDAQRALLRRAWADHGGVELGTEGDSFFVAFADAPAAVGAAVQAQRALDEASWPGGERLRVRIGLHSGAPLRHGDGYVGMDVHRAARVAASAHGGQIVVTEATAALASSLSGEIDFADLGRHFFKDLRAPEHLFEAMAPGLIRTKEAIRSLGSATSLPQVMTPLVGREVELADLDRLLKDVSVRLVTLTGPGGSGKTRLAVEAARSAAGRSTEGVFFVDLQAVSTQEQMWTTIASAIGVPPEASTPPDLFRALRHRAALVVLDNLEQIHDGGAAVGDLLTQTPGIRVLATSRAPVHVSGEQEYPVRPLDLPAGADRDSVDNAPAVQLFLQRAQSVRPSFSLTAANRQAIVAVCRRLDGLPLALELAAARSKVLTPQALLDRLDRALDLPSLTPGGSARQRTLRATIGWSYDLLDPNAQRLFRSLAVFPGGASLEAVATVWAALAAEEGDPVESFSGS